MIETMFGFAARTFSKAYQETAQPERRGKMHCYQPANSKIVYLSEQALSYAQSIPSVSGTQAVLQGGQHPVLRAIDAIILAQNTRFLTFFRGIKKTNSNLQAMRQKLVDEINEGNINQYHLENNVRVPIDGKQKNLLEILGEHRNPFKKKQQESGMEVDETERLQFYNNSF